VRRRKLGDSFVERIVNENQYVLLAEGNF